MTNHEKKIRSDWAEFKRKNSKKQGLVEISSKDINKIFSNMFK